MKIAIIGAGNVGSALAHGLTRAGHAVTISSSDAADARKLADEAGASAVENNRKAASAAEAVVLAVPYDAVEGIVSELGDALDGRVLVDVTNRFSAEQLDGPSNAEQIQRMAPGARVVKAFNTVFASYQADPRVGDAPLDGFVAGDDHAAKRDVMDVLESLGFRPVDAGPLAMARALEGMGTLNISLNMNNDWSWRTAWKLVGPLE
jgi:8-hydroxy-5-deazaflavin:NADPH oxidoreductase